MSKPSESLAHPYEPEPYPLLHAWPEFWWMPEDEKSALCDALARKYGGEGYRPRRDSAAERER